MEVDGGMLGSTHNIHLGGKLIGSQTKLEDAERILYTACQLANEWPVCFYVDKFGKKTELLPVNDTSGETFPD
jgi:hypothetical protein